MALFVGASSVLPMDALLFVVCVLVFLPRVCEIE